MPPKKDNKKKGKSDMGPAAVDPNDFVREAFELPVLGGVSSLDNTVSGDFFNPELLFDEWNDVENYSEITDTTKEIVVKYPTGIVYSEQKSVLEHLGVVTEAESDPKKAKGKGKAAEVVLEDSVSDETGKLLPRVFIGTTDDPEEFLSNSITTLFTRYKVPLPAGSETECPSENGAAATDGDDDVSPVETIAPRSSAVDDSGESTAEGPPASSTAVEEVWGGEVDSLMVSTFRLVERYFSNTENATNAPFLWRGIYPQLPTGKPVLNKSGKYCVKLFVAGKWRKVTVLDMFPFENGQMSLASSSNSLELWPTILAKAVYTVYTACGFHHTMLGSDTSIGDSALQNVSFVAFALHTLTGWSPSAPRSLKDMCAAQVPLHIAEMTFGGATVLSETAIPRQDAIVAVAEDESIANRQKTKKQLKDLILKRRMEKENLIKAIGKREELIHAVQEQVSKAFSEVFFVYSETDEPTPVVLPVLAVCQPNPDDYMDTRLLVSWATKPKVLGSVPEPDPEVPASTPVDYEWLSLKDLCARKVTYICGMDTKIRTAHSTQFSWHWDSNEKVDEGAKGKGGKAAAKGKDKAPAVSILNAIGTPYHGSDRGVFPPVLVKILSDEPVASSGVEEESKCQAGEAPRRSHSSLCVQLQADVCSISQGEGSSDEPCPFGLSDDVVLVLQEVRSDGDDPLVMRVQLSKDNPLPITRTTFHIPCEKIPSGAVLFWLRVVTKASLHMSFHFPTYVEVGMANEIWDKSGGLSQVIRDRTQPTHEKAEQLLFRLPLQLAPPPEGREDQSPDSVFLYLHTVDRSILNTLSLVAIDNDRNETRLLSSINGNCFILKNAQTIVTVIGRCMHAANNIPEFEWDAYILSRQPIRPPGDVIPQVVPEKLARQRYVGEYIPNNKLRIFRDILSAPASDFPLSLRLSMHSGEDQDTETTGIDVDEQLWFTARTYRKSDRKLVGEHHARSILQIYLLGKEGFLPDYDGPSAEADGGAKGGKGKPADKKKGAKDVGEVVDFILDVTIDESRMKIPETWRSRYPFRFRKANTPSPLGGMDERSMDSVQVAQDPQFSWQLDVLSGKVVRVQHDLYDLERYAAIKNKWDEEEGGRRSKGHNARMYMNLRAGRPVEEEGVTAISELAESLGKDEAMLQAREDVLALLPVYAEHVEEVLETSTMVADEVVQSERKFNVADAEKSTATAEDTFTQLLHFNEKYRQATLQRIAAIRSQASSNFDEAVALWVKREEYSSDVQKKNEAIKYLLSRSSEAIETVFPDQNADPKAKGKAKAKKK